MSWRSEAQLRGFVVRRRRRALPRGVRDAWVGSRPGPHRLSAQDATSSPTKTPAAYSSSATPVFWSTGTSARPVVPDSTTRVAGGRGDQEHQAEQGARTSSIATPTSVATATHDEQRVEVAALPVAEHHGQRALARRRVGRDVAQVVGDQDRAGERADAGRGEPAGRAGACRSGRTSCRAPPPGRRTRTPSPRRGRGSRRAASRRCRTRRRRSQPRRPAAATTPTWRRAPGRRPSPRRSRERRALHRPRPVVSAGADQPQRSDPVGVGAADPVGVVVGVVHADLQGQRDDQREERLPPHGVRRRTPRRRCRPGRGRRPRAACAGARLRSTAQGLPRVEDSGRHSVTPREQPDPGPRAGQRSRDPRAAAGVGRRGRPGAARGRDLRVDGDARSACGSLGPRCGPRPTPRTPGSAARASGC